MSSLITNAATVLNQLTGKVQVLQLEILTLFNTKYLASVYGALDYLAQLPSVDKSRIYILGMSAGAMLGILTKTKMANEALNGSGTQFKAIASLYPVCWSFSATIDGKAPGFFSDFTPADLSNWQSTPIRLFVPQLDDYDDRDPKTCENFIAKIPSEQARMSFSIKLYSNATHGKIGCTRNELISIRYGAAV